jgi:hypothetical protein
MNQASHAFAEQSANRDKANTSFEFNIKRSIALHTEFKLDQIVTQPNVDKYFDPAQPRLENDLLDDVFDAMRNLNKEGVGSNHLGKLTPDGTSFAAALDQACLDLAARLDGSELIYVELGP